MNALGQQRDIATAKFKVRPPNRELAAAYENWIPLIPLCSDSVRGDVPRPARGLIAESDLNDIVDLIERRFTAAMPVMFQAVPSVPLRLFLDALEHLIALFGKQRLKDYLKGELGNSISH